MERRIAWCSPYNAAFPIDSEGVIIMSVVYSQKTGVTHQAISHEIALFTYRDDKKCELMSNVFIIARIT